MPSPKVHFAKYPVTSISRRLLLREERAIENLEAHLFRCGKCIVTDGAFCERGMTFVDKVKEYIRRASDGYFYATQTEYGTTVRLEVPDRRMKHLLHIILDAKPAARRGSTMTVFYRRVERHKLYSILAVDRIIYR